MYKIVGNISVSSAVAPGMAYAMKIPPVIGIINTEPIPLSFDLQIGKDSVFVTGIQCHLT